MKLIIIKDSNVQAKIILIYYRNDFCSIWGIVLKTNKNLNIFTF